MNAGDLKEKLENNACHIHKQLPTMTILDNGTLRINTCCLLFKAQLHLLVDKQNRKHVEGFNEIAL